MPEPSIPPLIPSPTSWPGLQEELSLHRRARAQVEAEMRLKVTHVLGHPEGKELQHAGQGQAGPRKALALHVSPGVNPSSAPSQGNGQEVALEARACAWMWAFRS